MAKKYKPKKKQEAVSRGLPVEAKGLTEKQIRFAEEYIKCLNGKEAAINAGYSEASAGPTASSLLKHKGVKRYINFLQIKYAEELKITTKDVLESFASIAFVDHSLYYDDENNPIPLQELTPIQRKAIKDVSFKVSAKDKDKIKKEVTKYTFYPKTEALTKLANHLGMSLDKPNMEREKISEDRAVNFETLMQSMSVEELKQFTKIIESAQTKANKDDNIVQFKKNG